MLRKKKFSNQLDRHIRYDIVILKITFRECMKFISLCVSKNIIRLPSTLHFDYFFIKPFW